MRQYSLLNRQRQQIEVNIQTMEKELGKENGQVNGYRFKKELDRF